MWTNPLDRVPQVPQDWANHVIYGGALGMLCLPFTSKLVALAIVFAISAAKKVVDYFKEAESVQICVGKALVSCVWPLSLWLLK